MKRAFSAVIVAVLGVMSCSKKVDQGPSKSESVPAISAAPSASAAPIDEVQVPPVATSTAITTPTAVPEEKQNETKPLSKPVVPAPTPVPIQEPHARPKALPGSDPSKKPSPVGTSQAGRVVRFTCPSGEVPSQVMGGCMCGSEIANPCGPGVRVPDLRVEGKTCLFTCP